MSIYLLRVDIEQFGRVGAGGGHKLAEIHLARGDSLLPDDGHAVLDSVDALRDPGEVLLARLLLLDREGAVVAAGALQVVAVTEENGEVRYGLTSVLVLYMR